MHNLDSRSDRKGWGRARSAFALACLVLIFPSSALPKLRPLVPDMLDNLGALNRIGDAVALEDYEQVEAAARGLILRANAMQYLDLAALGLDRNRDPEWDAYLTAQRMAAEEVEAAARKADARAVMDASSRLVGNSCLACHASFRDPGNLLRSSVGFMTSFLASWRDMNRGMVLQDFDLIGRRAKELESLSGEIGSDEILEAAFRLGGSKQRRIFREFLTHITANAKSIQTAAGEQDVAAVLQGSRQMWIDGCISCHEKFRK